MAVAGEWLVFPEVSVHWRPPVAFLGATAATLLAYVLAWKSGVSPWRLVLVGLGMMAAASGLTTVFMLMNPTFCDASQISIWLVGNVYGSTWTDVAALLPWTALLVPAAWALARDLNAQRLGQEVATALGSPVAAGPWP